MCGRGGIGRRAGFRYQWRKSWGFESLRPHHLTARIFAAPAAQLQGDTVNAYQVMPSVPAFRWGRIGQQIFLPGLLQIKPAWKTRYGCAAMSQIDRITGHGKIKDKWFDECV